MTNPSTPSEDAMQRAVPWPKNCGPYCRGFDPISGTCDTHYTEADKIVDRVTSAFRNDLRSIMGGSRR